MNFPKEFFQDEVRCDFQISELMKRAWAAEMDILQIVIDICEKHNIPYFADSGTLLGDVRHQGFIPWDDDIDIAIKREDYNKLIQILPQELPDGIVLAGMYADSERLQKAALSHQLRVIIDETYWSLPALLNRFHGFPFYRTGIDIFPLDYIPRDPELAELQQTILTLVYTVASKINTLREEGTLEQRLCSIEELCNVSLPRDETLDNKLWRLFDSLCCLYTDEESDDVTNYPYLLDQPSYRMSKKCYDETIYLPFETMTLAAPKNYHEVLTAIYGDYMTLPPEEDRGCKVHAELVDPDKSYTEYQDWYRTAKFSEYSRSIR